MRMNKVLTENKLRGDQFLAQKGHRELRKLMKTVERGANVLN